MLSLYEIGVGYIVYNVYLFNNNQKLEDIAEEEMEGSFLLVLSVRSLHWLSDTRFL